MEESTKHTEPKKISIGFKITKPVALVQKKAVKKEFITSINEGAIVSDTVKKAKEALVIPIPSASGSYKERLLCAQTKKTAIKEEALNEANQCVDVSKMSLEERAAMEILAATKKTETVENKSTAVIPSANQSKEAKESTIDDYESIPVAGFGMAMLRGMGLKEESIEAETKTDSLKFRPKGLGLGADSVVKPRALKIPLKSGEVLTIKKGAFVVVLAGKFKDFYGTIKDFDGESERMAVSLALHRERVVLSASYVQLVTEKEYQLYSKIPLISEVQDTKKDYGLIISKAEEKDRRTDAYSSRSPTRRKEGKKSHRKSDHRRRSKSNSSRSSDDSRRYRSSSKRDRKRHDDNKKRECRDSYTERRRRRDRSQN